MDRHLVWLLVLCNSRNLSDGSPMERALNEVQQDCSFNRQTRGRYLSADRPSPLMKISHGEHRERELQASVTAVLADGLRTFIWSDC